MLTWSLAIALILVGGTMSKVPVLETIACMLTVFLGLSVGCCLAWRQVSSKNWLVEVLEPDSIQSE